MGMVVILGGDLSGQEAKDGTIERETGSRTGEKQRADLEAIVRDSKASARRVRQAWVLLLADEDRRE